MFSAASPASPASWLALSLAFCLIGAFLCICDIVRHYADNKAEKRRLGTSGASGDFLDSAARDKLKIPPVQRFHNLALIAAASFYFCSWLSCLVSSSDGAFAVSLLCDLYCTCSGLFLIGLHIFASFQTLHPGLKTVKIRKISTFLVVLTFVPSTTAFIIAATLNSLKLLAFFRIYSAALMFFSCMMIAVNFSATQTIEEKLIRALTQPPRSCRSDNSNTSSRLFINRQSGHSAPEFQQSAAISPFPQDSRAVTDATEDLESREQQKRLDTKSDQKVKMKLSRIATFMRELAMLFFVCLAALAVMLLLAVSSLIEQSQNSPSVNSAMFGVPQAQRDFSAALVRGSVSALCIFILSRRAIRVSLITIFCLLSKESDKKYLEKAMKAPALEFPNGNNLNLTTAPLTEEHPRAREIRPSSPIPGTLMLMSLPENPQNNGNQPPSIPQQYPLPSSISDFDPRLYELLMRFQAKDRPLVRLVEESSESSGRNLRLPPEVGSAMMAIPPHFAPEPPVDQNFSDSSFPLIPANILFQPSQLARVTGTIRITAEPANTEENNNIPNLQTVEIQ